MSSVVVDAARHHHDWSSDPENGSTTIIVALANQLAHQCGFTNNIPGSRFEIESDLLEAAEIPEAQLEAIREVVVQEIARTEEAFQIV